MSSEILTRLEEIKGLPALPTIIQRFNQKVDDSNCSMHDLVAIICDDPPTYENVLKLSNSSIYSSSTAGTIESIETAIVRMGFSTTRTIVCSSSLLGVFKNMKLRGFDFAEFWMHSLSTGIVAQIIYDHCQEHLSKPVNASKLYLSGLMHDMGKMILQQFFPEEFTGILSHTRLNSTTTLNGEEKILGTDHTQIGSWLIKQWTDDAILHEAIRWHHDPLKAHYDHQGIAAIIHTADYICNRRRFGNSGNKSVPTLKNEIWNFLKINEDVMTTIYEDIDLHDVRENTSVVLRTVLRSGQELK